MSTALPTTPTTEPRDRRRRRGVVFLKFGLAGAALLGIAAAATSAAWTDNAWFSGTATAATVQLEGAVTSVNGVAVTSPSWIQADDTSGYPAVTIDSSVIGALLPGDHVTVVLGLKNAGTTDLALAAPQVSLGAGTGDLLSTDSTDTTHAVVTLVGTATSPLGSGQMTSVTLDLKVPSGWSEANEGKSQPITVAFQGQAQH